MPMRWYRRAMRVSIDGVGRVVIPKSVRTALGITAGTALELITDGAGLRLEPVRLDQRPIGIGEDGLPLLGAVQGATLTDDDVRALRDELLR